MFKNQKQNGKELKASKRRKRLRLPLANAIGKVYDASISLASVKDMTSKYSNVDVKSLTIIDDEQREPDEALLESIKAMGVLAPVIVNAANEVLDGRRRVRAAIQLDLQKISTIQVNATGDHADLWIELAGVDATILYTPRTPLRECLLWAQREELLIKLGQRAKSNTDRGDEPEGDNLSPLAKTTEEMATEAGVTKRTAQRRLAVGRKLLENPELYESIEGTPVEGHHGLIARAVELPNNPQTLEQLREAFTVSTEDVKPIEAALREVERVSKMRERAANKKTPSPKKPNHGGGHHNSPINKDVEDFFRIGLALARRFVDNPKLYIGLGVRAKADVFRGVKPLIEMLEKLKEAETATDAKAEQVATAA